MEAAFSLSAETKHSFDYFLWEIGFPAFLVWQHCHLRHAGEWTVEPQAASALQVQSATLDRHLADESEFQV